MGDRNNTGHLIDGWSRKWKTLWCWSQLYLGYKAAQARERLLDHEQVQAFWDKQHAQLAERVWSNIAELRGWWVKVGQFLSTRGDLLPSAYITHLAKLQDMLPTSPFSVVKNIVESELGKPLEELFDSFEETAIASASIGQVHRATLRPGGQQVVVKVQHPGVDVTLSQDMTTLTQMTWAFGMLEKGLNLGPILNEWQKAAADELDFRTELRHQMRARQAVLNARIPIIVPECYPELTTKRVMVMEYCNGFKITDLEKLNKHKVDRDLLMTRLCQSFAYQIHVDGMFNGDPHPGNILVQIDPATGDAMPVLLDWGLVKRFDDVERIAFSKTVYAIANMDVMGLMSAIEELGFRFKATSTIDPEVYMDALRLGFFRDSGADSSEANTNIRGTTEAAGINRKTALEKNPIDDWPKDIIFFVRVASLLHGLCLQLNAKVPFLQLLVDRAEQCLLERYIPPSPRLYTIYPALPQGAPSYGVFEWKLHRVLMDLLENRNLILGAQVAVFLQGRMIADTCVGRMGPVNNRPVQRDTLFCLMSVCLGMLATSVLALVDEGLLNLDEPVCHYWDGFVRRGKEAITVREVLSHRAGLHASLPRDMRLTELADYETMISIFEDAAPVEPRTGRYAYLTAGWLFSELVHSATGSRIDSHFSSKFIKPLGLANEMFFPVPKFLVASSTPRAAPQQAGVVVGDAKHTPGPSRRGAGLAGAESPPKPPGVYLLELKVEDIVRNSTASIVKPNLGSTRPFLDDVVVEGLASAKQPSSLCICGDGVSANRSRRSWVRRAPKPLVSSNDASSGTECLPLDDRLNNLLERFATSRREIGVARIDSRELVAKLNEARRRLARDSAATGPREARFPSKYLQKIAQARAETARAARSAPRPGVTALELAELKPHVLDPLIFDSSRLYHRVVPANNCRATARAVSRFYAAIMNGRLIRSETLAKAAQVHTIDNSLDALVLSGGLSRMWGLGYQLFPCRDLLARSSDGSPRIVMGLGHADLGGSVALCVPERKLSIAILLNDVLTGPLASRVILTFLFRCLGLEPCWDVALPLSALRTELASNIAARAGAQHNSTAALQREASFTRIAVLPPASRPVGATIP